MLPESNSNKDFQIPKEDVTFKSLIKYNLIKAVLIGAVISTLIMSVFMSFLPSLAEKININTSHIGLIISLSILIAGLLQVPFGKVSDKFDRGSKLIIIGIGMTVSMFAFFMMPFCPNFGALLITGIFIGLGMAVAVPSLTGISVNIGQKTGMTFWMGVVNIFRSIGFVLTPLFAGIIMDHMGVDAVFYIFGMFLLFALSLYVYYSSKKIGQKI